ncbi:diaminopimelate decarboxylase [Desulforhopalus vacuolatus]|uniref:diaminopimelate decarboxylase n=1 Tax=Desulforhopalus vacuolatus TaxID=40414 RepID=UPI001963112B|nr:diaminopimelate decarboxylase [Desulforhopalus vacuolatus]MBM9520230.1 diaminopimelate decarboxylase [Desulforhopalus vacuolatus]
MKLWWERKGLAYNENNQVIFADQNVQKLGEQLGTPLFLYSADRILENIERVQRALENTGLPNRVYYALKANRFEPLLTWIKSSTTCGVDVCSPAEVRHAMSCGFYSSDISYTATSVSNADLDFLTNFPDLKLNADGCSMIRRIGERTPGRSIGIRINPAIGTGYASNELLRYSGEKPTKFGIYISELEQALQLAQQYDLRIDRVHFHTGCGYLNDQLPAWEKILRECLKMIERIPTVEAINLGGGLGVPLTAEDNHLDLSEWASVIRRVFGDTSYEINVEPGTYIVKDAGVLVLEANSVETKAEKCFVGVNGGFNLTMEPVHYKLPCEPVPCILPDSIKKSFAPANLSPVTVAGNINEALDVLIEDFMAPPIEEGDLLAFINAGAYTSSMSSNHCMRGEFSEYLLLG